MMIIPMVLLIGNYALDQQHSMQGFGELMLGGLRAAGVEAELVRPGPVLGKIFGARGFGKWLAYIDKYILFPFVLRPRLRRADIVHICDHSNALYIPHRRSRPFVVTCHDLLAVRGGMGEQTDCPASFTGRFLQRWILRGLRRADAVVCVSQATAIDAERLVQQANPRTKIDIVPLALNFDYRKVPTDEARSALRSLANFDVNLPFALHVGSNERRKNRAGVLRIFARVKDKWNGRFVFAGALDQELTDLAKSLGLHGRIIEIKNADGATLRALYNCAVALVFPSRFEGFGWPIIEAQACGCPVICSDAGPMPEAAGEAGLYHPVDDEEGFAADLLRLTNSQERAVWSERSLRNAAKFSRDTMIARYLQIYRQLCPDLAL
jgi:glycosyltransferase involved in cell wall biosynthesis